MFWDYEKDTFVTYGEINSWLTRLNDKYNICKGNLSSHRLRHYALTHWKEYGVPIDIIQYLAGHVNGSNITTDIYIETSFDYVNKTLMKII